jgi:hypothetical protein
MGAWAAARPHHGSDLVAQAGLFNRATGEKRNPSIEATGEDAAALPVSRAFKGRMKANLRSGVVSIAAFIATVAFFSDLGLGDRTQTPAPHEPTVAQSGGAEIDPFVNSIDRCERLLVTRQEVASVLGFQAGHPVPTRSVTVSADCIYTSYIRGQGSGHLWIYAHMVDADGLSVPFPSRTRSVQSIGDRAEFSPGDVGPVDGPERATTILRVWSGDLILTFEGWGVWDSYGLPAFRQLAGSASTMLNEGT